MIIKEDTSQKRVSRVLHHARLRHSDAPKDRKAWNRSIRRAGKMEVRGVRALVEVGCG